MSAGLRKPFPIGSETPERWAALNAHDVMLWSYGVHRYDDDPQVAAWISTLTALLTIRSAKRSCAVSCSVPRSALKSS